MSSVSRVRIYELSKELDLENKEVLEAAEKLLIAVKSYSSSVGVDEAASIRRFFKSNGKSLPVWTDEIGRELRVHIGLDHQPTNEQEARTVMSHGLKGKAYIDLWEFWLKTYDVRVLKQIYKERARMTHPDIGGSTEAFKMVQIAYSMLEQYS
jgi:hypothetical protein